MENILNLILWIIIWLAFWVSLTYIFMYNKYWNIKEVKKYIQDRDEYKKKMDEYKLSSKEYQIQTVLQMKDIENTKREIMEKNKILAEDKVIVERLWEIKWLSDKVSELLKEYDKNLVTKLIETHWTEIEIDEETDGNEKKDKKWS